MIHEKNCGKMCAQKEHTSNAFTKGIRSMEFLTFIQSPGPNTLECIRVANEKGLEC